MSSKLEKLLKEGYLPKDSDDEAPDFWGALDLEHLMQHSFLFV